AQALSGVAGRRGSGQEVSFMTLCAGACAPAGVRAITRSTGGGVARSTCAGSIVMPKCDSATAEDCTTTVATISVKVVIADPRLPSDSVERRYTASEAIGRRTRA